MRQQTVIVEHWKWGLNQCKSYMDFQRRAGELRMIMQLRNGDGTTRCTPSRPSLIRRFQNDLRKEYPLEDPEASAWSDPNHRGWIRIPPRGGREDLEQRGYACHLYPDRPIWTPVCGPACEGK